MKKVAFAGTFDPITDGHVWVIEEGLNIADEVVVMIAHNPKKKTMFTEFERKAMIDEVLREKNIDKRVTTVLIRNEYVAQAAAQYDCNYLIRGIRSALDFDYETLIQQTNTTVLKGAKTIFVMPPRDLESVSSSFVKSLVGSVGWHWYIKSFLPAPVYQAWLKKYLQGIVAELLDKNVWRAEVQQKLLSEVFKRYGESDRVYHNLEHIVHCLQELEWLISNGNLSAEQIEKLVLSILTHDIIYNAKDKNHSDEELSAQWFSEFSKTHLNQTFSEVEDMIRATGYLSGGKIAQTPEEKILCSIDLAILAKQLDNYKWYANAVRKEYSFVSDNDFYKGRIHALETLLKRDRLYLSDEFSHYEQLARQNLQHEISYLKSMQVEI